MQLLVGQGFSRLHRGEILTSDSVVDRGPGNSPKPAGQQRLGAIVWFRAAAIILIVAGHSYESSGVNLVTGLDRVFSDLIKGSTALFVFISGLLFDYVFSARYSYWSFVFDRVRKLVIPYCLLTALAGITFYHWATGGASLVGVFSNLVLGNAFQAYWYIPFIAIMFALAPLHRLFMRLSVSYQITIVIIAAILAGVVQRPVSNDNVFQSIVFYMPIYLSGIFLSLHRERLMPALQKNWPWLLLVAVLLAVIQASNGQSDNMHKPFFAIRSFELMGFQKLMLCFALMGLFASLSPAPAHGVHLVADTSFAIFFLHPFVLKFVEGTAPFQLTNFPWINLAIATFAIIALCTLVALALRAVFGSMSKYVTGY